MSGHVGHKDPKPVSIDRNELVEIAGDSSHRTVSGVDPKTIDFRDGVREYRGLYFAGYSELAFDRKQATFIGEDKEQSGVSK
jgi:hypothetical protein